MSTTLEELEALQAQMDLLKKKAKTEIQSQILPFIRDGKAKCEFRDFFYPLIITSTSENLNTLIKYIKGNQDCGYHFGCSVSDVSTIRYDDGGVTLRLEFKGPRATWHAQFVKEMKALNIKVDFSRYKGELTKKIQNAQEELEKVVLFEKELSL